MQKKRLGKSGIEVSPVGFGCWAVGGPFWLDGLPDDNESIRAIGRALDLGINIRESLKSIVILYPELMWPFRTNDKLRLCNW